MTGTRSESFALAALVALWAATACSRDEQAPVESPRSAAAAVESPAAGEAEAGTLFDFGKVSQDDAVQIEFSLRNDSAAAMRISGVKLSTPLQLSRMPAVIEPGSASTLKLTLDTKKVEGEYEGQLAVMLDGAGTPRVFTVKGTVVPGIEILPLPAFFISTSKGVAKTETREIVSHDAAPLALSIKSPPVPEFAATLEPLEEGKRWRLSVTIPADAPPGKSSTRLELASSSATTPIVYVGVNTQVRERVYSFPDAVDFGAIPLARARDGSAAASGASQTLMVYQTDGKSFSAKAGTDVPGLELSVEPAASGDRVQITAALGKDTGPGPLRGSITVLTNDPDFPELRVPVSGTISPD